MLNFPVVLSLIEMVLNTYSLSKMAFEFEVQILLFKGIFINVYIAHGFFPCAESQCSLCCCFAVDSFNIFLNPTGKGRRFLYY